MSESTKYTLVSTSEHVVYTLFNPQTGGPIIQMYYTPEQAEDLGSSLMLHAAAVRMEQANSQQDGDSNTK